MPIDLAAVSSALLTYAAHSAVACIIALLASRWLPRPHDRDLLWKTAILAPLATTAISLIATRWIIRAPILDLGAVARRFVSAPLPRRVTMIVQETAAGRSVARTVVDPVEHTLSIVTIAIVATLVIVSLLRLLFRYRALAVHISDRRPLLATDAFRVTVCDELPTPVALGADEICLPSFVVADFNDAKRAALVAHEAAHLARRDPHWFALLDFVGALTAFQPLTAMVLRAFRRDVELICDESAVRTTRDRSALIAALADLAAPFDALACTPAARSSDAGPLVARAERIAVVDILQPTSRAARATAVVAFASCVALIAIPIVAPGPHDELPPLPGHELFEHSGAHLEHDTLIIKHLVRASERVTRTVELK